MRWSERACEQSLLTRHYHEVSVITHETAGQRGLRSRLSQGVLCPRNLQQTFIRHSRQAGDSQRDPESRNLKDFWMPVFKLFFASPHDVMRNIWNVHRCCILSRELPLSPDLPGRIAATMVFLAAFVADR